MFSQGRGPNSIEEAYKLQRALRSIREARGEKVLGFKVGYTSKGVRENLEGIIGEGVAASRLPNGVWVGSLT